MDSNEDQTPRNTEANSTQFSSFSGKYFYLISILMLIVAISYTILTTKTQIFRGCILRTRPPFSQLNTFQQLLKTLHFTSVHEQGKNFEAPYCILWMAPFLSGGGYSSEAWSYILALNSYINKQNNPSFRLAIEQHGDLENVEFWEGLPLEMRNLAIELHNTRCRLNQTVVVCHSEPGAWYPPLFQTLPCPPVGYGKFEVVIGRTMFETDRVNDEHVRRCNAMDFVWVPTEFHVNTFKQSGVEPTKVKKIVQPVDLDFFDPLKVAPLDLDSVAKLVLGSDKSGATKKRFVFLSIFKWEYRKGWDVLLRSYLEEFSEDDDVALYLLTTAYHSDTDFTEQIIDYVKNSGLRKPVKGHAQVYVINTHIAQVDLPRLYRAADAFVLPSRGEGWGRPIVEAMAMSLPVIATNWSGPTEYLTNENSYPLPLERTSEVKEGPFKGHLWAEPSVDKLRSLMRRVVSNLDEGKVKGRQARLDMSMRFSPEIVAEKIISHLHEVVAGFH